MPREQGEEDRRGKRHRVAREPTPRREEEEERTEGNTEAEPEAPRPPPTPSEGGSPAATASWFDESSKLIINLRRIVALEAERRSQIEIAQETRTQSERLILTVESTFCDIDDGSAESHEARKVALHVSQSIVSLSSFAGRKRIRVCSGFVMRWNDCTGTATILTSAALVRPPCGDDVKVKVRLPSGDISDGQISLVDFHHNIGLVEVRSNLKLQEAVILEDVIDKGDVLALGRAYEGGLLMCSRGKINNRANIFECSELSVSSCNITMAGTGGPLVNYNGHVLGLNFFEEKQTPFLSMAIISRCLEHHERFGRIFRPWLGFRFTSIQMVPLSDLEYIYQKFSDVDDGLCISHVVEGSPADVAGLCEGDIIIKCGEKALSTAPEFGAILLDICKEHMEAFLRETNRDCSGEKITIEIVIKQQKDGDTVVKNISAGLLKEINYNRWTIPIPIYSVKRDSTGWR